MREPTVSAALVRRFLDFADARGAAMDALVERCRINEADLEDPDNRVPFSLYVALVRAAKALCSDPALPLHFAEAVDMSEFSVVGMLTYASETMMEAFEQLNRYGQLVTEVDVVEGGRFVLESRNDELWLVDTRRDPNAFPELTETTFTRLICGPRRFLPRPSVLRAQVTHSQPAHSGEYDRIWQCPIDFGSHRNAIQLDPTIPSHRVALQPRYVFGILNRHAETLLAELEKSTTTRGRVERLLVPILHKGDVGMEKIAAKLALSPRTLLRRLTNEGVTFEKVLDELRHAMALDYLRERRTSVNETAYLLGFSDPSAFSRAFKRWTGRTPAQFRQEFRSKRS